MWLEASFIPSGGDPPKQTYYIKWTNISYYKHLKTDGTNKSSFFRPQV